MSEIGQNLKELVIKGIDAIENKASSLASSTRNKVNEIALKGKRSEIMEAFGEKAYEAWKNGAELPEDLVSDLREVMAIDAELNQMQNNSSETEEAVSGTDPENIKGTEATGDSAETKNAEIPVIDIPRREEPAAKDIPLSDAIDNLFSDPPKMDQMADKINLSLDEMGKSLLKFSNDFGKELSDMAEQLMNGNGGKDE